MFGNRNRSSFSRHLLVALLTVAVALSPLTVAPLQADLLRLKSGEELEGFYIREVDGVVEFKLADGTDREIPADEVANLEMGYTGVPLCYRTKEKPDEEVCNVLLHKIEGNQMVIADQRGYLSLRKIPLHTVRTAELNRVGEFQKIAPLLQKDLKIRATQAQDQSPPDGEAPSDGETPPDGEAPQQDSTVEGEIAEIRGDRVFIRDSNGELREVEDGRIQLVAFQGPPKAPEAEREFRFSDLYPGVPQYGSDQRNLAYGIFGSFHFALLGFLFEYNAATQASAKAQSDITVLLFNNTTYLEEFNRHQRNQAMFLGIAGLVYIWHVVDWFYLGPPPDSSQLAPDEQSPAMLFDGYEYSIGTHREAVYRMGLRLAF